jgi:hypothetical protein
MKKHQNLEIGDEVEVFSLSGEIRGFVGGWVEVRPNGRQNSVTVNPNTVRVIRKGVEKKKMKGGNDGTGNSEKAGVN